MNRFKNGGPLLIGPLLFFLIIFTPFEIAGVEQGAKTFLAIFVWVACQWLFTPIPMFASGLMGVALASILGVASAQQVLAPFAHPIIFLFLGGFLLARAMEEEGLDKKISVAIITHPWVKGSFKRTFVAIMITTAFFSMWVSNTATTAMMLPIMLGLIRGIEIESQKIRSSLLIAMAYSATIGGLATPIGSPPNIIAIGMLQELAEVQLTFLNWMMIGGPLALVSLFILVFLVFKKIPKQILDQPIETQGLERVYSKKLNPNEKLVIISFILTIFFWFAPSITQAFIPKHPWSIWANQRLDPSLIVLLTIFPLFLFPLRANKKILTAESLKHIDWSSLLLFGSGLSLGGLLFQTGLATVAGESLISFLADGHFFIAMVIIVAATVFFTEFTSNTASANILLPIIIAATIQLGISPLGPALMVALACNLAFMLPVATPPNAIVYGSGHVYFKDLLRWGIIMNLIGITLISLSSIFI